MFVRTRLLAATLVALASSLSAQSAAVEYRDPRQRMDEDFAKAYLEWTRETKYGSPLVDHLPLANGIPTPKSVLGYHIGAPKKLTYYADILKYYRALAAAAPQRVKIETIGRSDENRELVVVWISSEQNMARLAQNKANLAKIADPRGLSEPQIRALINDTKPQYHFMGGLHSGETGPSEMMMELAYRLVAETSPYITNIRNNVYVTITPVADADGRDRNVDWFYLGLERQAADSAANAGNAGASAAPAAPGGGRGGGIGGLPYWGKYVYHDNNRDINLSQVQMRAITDWYHTAHPPIMHDLHESLTLLYTYSGGPPQNPNLDPLLFSELPWFSNFELSQFNKFGMPGVYTHAFMDGWSPGYLGSVAYNHNGLMKMYETQSGNDQVAGSGSQVAGGRGDGGRGGGRGGAGDSSAAAGRGAGGQDAGGRGTGNPPSAAGNPPGGGRGPATGNPAPATGGRATIPTGRGGGQPREWYRGIPVPPGMPANFTRRMNTNYMQTGVLSALQLAAMFPNLIIENFYTKTRNSMTATDNGGVQAYVFPMQKDMTRVAALVNVLRAQMIEVGTLNAETKIGAETFPAGSYVVKLNQPYGRLAKNLLEKQDYPDPALTTYDDSGWSMNWAFDVDMKTVDDKAILAAAATPVTKAEVKGTVAGSGNAGLAVAHNGSNSMISFRYALRNVPMRIAEASFTDGSMTYPAGSFIITDAGAMANARAQVERLGLKAGMLSAAPTVASHDADVPRVAIYSNWGGTQELGWYRYSFDQFGIPFDLIYKERIAKGDLRKDYDVIVMAAQNITKASVMAAPAARPQPYKRSDQYKFLGMYGETDDMSGGFGQAGVDAMATFLSEGGTLITALAASRFPIEMGWAGTVDTEAPIGVQAQKPLIQAEITKTDHPVFYGWDKKVFPIKFGQGQQVFRVGVADQGNVLAQFVGGDQSVLSGLMTGADNIRGRAFAVDIPQANNGKGRVIMFANNPVYRWQNHGEFNMVFNSIINWNDVPARK
jgi:hypothetical protein